MLILSDQGQFDMIRAQDCRKRHRAMGAFHGAFFQAPGGSVFAPAGPRGKGNGTANPTLMDITTGFRAIFIAPAKPHRRSA
jgi:hypothetical protein